MLDVEVIEKINAVINAKSKDRQKCVSELVDCLLKIYGYKIKPETAIEYFNYLLKEGIPSKNTKYVLSAIYSKVQPNKCVKCNHLGGNCDRGKFLKSLKESCFLKNFEKIELLNDCFKKDWKSFKKAYGKTFLQFDPETNFKTDNIAIKPMSERKKTLTVLIDDNEKKVVPNINNENEIVSNKDKALNKKRKRTTDNEQINKQNKTNNEQKTAVNISNNSSLRKPIIKQINNDGEVLNEESINNKRKPENQK